MTKTCLLLLPIFLPLGAPAQSRFQNWDMYYEAGPVFAATQTIGGSDVTLYSSAGYAWTWGFGWQFMRLSRASLWLDVPMTFTEPSHQTATIPGSITLVSTMLVPGVRVMLPLASRIAVFGVAGGGGGFFKTPCLESSNPPLTTNAIDHGVLRVGGGVDFRLSEYFSLRLELTDYVSGRDLAGVPGRNHLLPMLGFAFHK